MLQIRKIKPEDLEFVLQLTEETGYSSGKLLSNIEGFLICENDNAKCGCGCIVSFGTKGFMSWLTVTDSARRKKLGSAVTKALLNIADLKGIKEVYAEGLCPDFLKAMGFEKNEDTVTEVEMKEILGLKEIPDLYKVSLEGYFKPCSHK